MDQQEKYINLIDRYLNGQMTKEEQKDFEHLLDQDEKLKTHYDFVKDTQKAHELIELVSLKQKLGQSEVFIKKRKRNAIYLKVAASLLILVALGYLIFSNQQSTNLKVLFEKYYEAYPNVVAPVSRSGDSKNTVYAAYENGDFQKVIDELKSSNSTSDTMQFYLGQAQLAIGNYKEAINAFESIKEESKFYEQSVWYRALADLKLNDIKSCKNALQKLIDSKSSYRQRAEELIDEL